MKDAVKRSTLKIDMSGENVAGVILPIMHIIDIEDTGNKKIKLNSFLVIFFLAIYFARSLLADMKLH